MSILYQAGILISMLQGVYEGDITIKELSSHGDIGLGTFDKVDGEMIAIDGQFYQTDCDGKAFLASANTKTPFALVTHFKPETQLELKDICNLNHLNKLLDEYLPTKNIFYMIRINADIKWIKLRCEECQMQPYQPFATTLPDLQHIFELNNIAGSMVTTRAPEYSAKLTVPGFHHHFINNARTMGGHVFDCQIPTATAWIMPIRQFYLSLINNQLFDSTKLDINIEDAIKKTEFYDKSFEK